MLVVTCGNLLYTIMFSQTPNKRSGSYNGDYNCLLKSHEQIGRLRRMDCRLGSFIADTSQQRHPNICETAEIPFLLGKNFPLIFKTKETNRGKSMLSKMLLNGRYHSYQTAVRVVGSREPFSPRTPLGYGSFLKLSPSVSKNDPLLPSYFKRR